MKPRAALITGGSSGIGLALARALGEEGFRLTLAAHVESEVEAAVEALRGAGLDARGTVTDVSSEQEIVEMATAHRAAWGRLDVLVNNAGIGLSGPVERIDSGDLDRLLAVNLRGVVLCTREALPLLREAGAEHGAALIVNMASLAGKISPGWLSVYSAAKAAVINFSQSTQREVGAAGIRCTALAPGFVDTPMTKFAKGRVTQAKMIRPEDVGEAVRFLLRTSASCHVPEIVLGRRP